MISWDNFEYFVAPAALCWIVGAVLSARQATRSRAALWATLAGTLIFAVFIVGLWTTLSRPPLRTMGETRLWYSFFLSISGLITYWRWRYRWVLPFTTLLALVFCMINILKPEIHDQSLMPALQSPWFIPHVTVYMFSYSVLGCSFILSCIGLYRHKPEYLDTLDQLVYVGLAFLTLGMLSGAVWAKDAWGNYWSWDPQETWAAITWFGYLLYVHLRLMSGVSPRKLYLILILSFLTLQICWYGVNYLPSAEGSVHVYSQT